MTAYTKYLPKKATRKQQQAGFSFELVDFSPFPQGLLSVCSIALAIYRMYSKNGKCGILRGTEVWWTAVLGADTARADLRTISR